MWKPCENHVLSPNNISNFATTTGLSLGHSLRLGPCCSAGLVGCWLIQLSFLTGSGWSGCEVNGAWGAISWRPQPVRGEFVCPISAKHLGTRINMNKQHWTATTCLEYPPTWFPIFGWFSGYHMQLAALPRTRPAPKVSAGHLVPPPIWNCTETRVTILGCFRIVWYSMEIKKLEWMFVSSIFLGTSGESKKICSGPTIIQRCITSMSQSAG